MWPLLTRAYQKIDNKIYERRRQKLYRKYINDIEKRLEDEKNNQRKTLIVDCQCQIPIRI